MAVLQCDACGRLAGEHPTYEAWSDAASTLRWEIGEETVICAQCLARCQESAEDSTCG